MAQLPLPEAINRFKENEERTDVFNNGGEDEYVTPNNGNPPYPTQANGIKKLVNVGGMIGAANATALQAIVPTYDKQIGLDEATGNLWRWNASATPPAWINTGRNFYQDAVNYVNANKRFKPVQIVASTNGFNDLFQEGEYFHWGANLTSAQVPHAPFYVSGNLPFGRLVVLNANPADTKNNSVWQIFYPYTDGYAPMYRKAKQGTNEFDDVWYTVISSENWYSLSTALTTGQDILTLPYGRYHIPSLDIGNSLLNMPTSSYKFGSITVGVITLGYKAIRFESYGRDANVYINKNYESNTWGGWKKFTDYDAATLVYDAKYATKTALASAIAEALNNVTQDKYFGKQYTTSELTGSVLYNASYYTGYNNVSGVGGANFNCVKANLWCTTAEQIQYRVYYGATVSTDTRGAFVLQANVNSPSYSGVCKNFPVADSGAAQEIQLDQVISIPPSTPFVIVFRSATTKIIFTRYFSTATGNLESRGFNIVSTNGDWGTAQLAVTSPSSGFVSAGFQLLLKLPNSGVTPITPYTPTLVLPPRIYVMQDVEANLYLEHTLREDYKLYDFDVTCTKGLQKVRGWRWKPTANDALGDYALTLGVYDKQLATLLTSKATTVKLVDKNAKSGQNQLVNFVGDSLTASGAITQSVLDIAATDVMGVTLIGSRGTGANKHEGRGGYTINDFTTVGRTYYLFTVSGITTPPAINATVYTYNGGEFTIQESNLSGGSGTLLCSYTGTAPTNGASGTLTKKDSSAIGDSTIAFSNVQSQSGNPFWNPAANGGAGGVDYAYYLSTYSLPTPDRVMVMLGINDTFGLTSDPAVSDFCTTAFPKFDLLINSILALNANVKVGIAAPPTYASQDAFGYNYGNGQTSRRARRNITIFNEKLYAYYENKDPRIFVYGGGINVDAENNFPESAVAVNAHNTKTSIEQTNGVHPALGGSQQLGDSAFILLKHM